VARAKPAITSGPGSSARACLTEGMTIEIAAAVDTENEAQKIDETDIETRETDETNETTEAADETAEATKEMTEAVGGAEEEVADRNDQR
jgi:hypothetical protein